MVQKLKRHYPPILMIGGVLAGCIYTGNWVPFIIVSIILICAGMVTAIVLTILSEKKKRDELFDKIKKTRRVVHVRHIIESRPADTFVPSERFEQDNDETIH